MVSLRSSPVVTSPEKEIGCFRPGATIAIGRPLSGARIRDAQKEKQREIDMWVR